jgi:hypothetical protein
VLTDHKVEVAFEAIHVRDQNRWKEASKGPTPDNCGNLIQRLQLARHLGATGQRDGSTSSLETALRVYRRFYETVLAQHSQVPGYGRLLHRKLSLDLSTVVAREQIQDRAAVRLRNDLECRPHPLCILYRAYTFQGICRPGKLEGTCGTD